MIEAVNTVLSYGSVLKGESEKFSAVPPVSTENTVSVAAESKTSAPQAPYVSPYIRVDNNYNKAVLAIRDSDTGDILREFPSEGSLRARQAADTLQKAQASFENQPKAQTVDIEVSVNTEQATAPQNTVAVSEQGSVGADTNTTVSTDA